MVPKTATISDQPRSDRRSRQSRKRATRSVRDKAGLPRQSFLPPIERIVARFFSREQGNPDSHRAPRMVARGRPRVKLAQDLSRLQQASPEGNHLQGGGKTDLYSMPWPGRNLIIESPPGRGSPCNPEQCRYNICSCIICSFSICMFQIT